MHNTDGTQINEPQIKAVFDKLGKVLEKEKEDLKEKHKKSRPKLGKLGKFIYAVLVASFFVGVAWYSIWVSTIWGLVLIIVYVILLSVLLAYRLFLPDWRTIKMPVHQRINEIGKRTIGNWTEGRKIAKDTHEHTLNHVELLLKYELDEFQARLDFVIDLLKSINPSLVAVGVLFGIFGISLKGSVVAVILLMIGAVANILVLTTWIGLRPEIIRFKQCLSILAQAKELKKIGIGAAKGQSKSSKQPTQ